MWDKSRNFLVDGCYIYQTSGENTRLCNLMRNANLMVVLRKPYPRRRAFNHSIFLLYTDTCFPAFAK